MIGQRQREALKRATKSRTVSTLENSFALRYGWLALFARGLNASVLSLYVSNFTFPSLACELNVENW